VGWLAVHPLAIVALLSGSRASRHLGLGTLALLGVLSALFWKFFGPPNFPFLLMLSISLGLQLALIVYRKLLRLLAQ
jgi:hypothetical protein